MPQLLVLKKNSNLRFATDKIVCYVVTFCTFVKFTVCIKVFQWSFIRTVELNKPSVELEIIVKNVNVVY